MPARSTAVALLLLALLAGCDTRGHMHATRPAELEGQQAPVATRGPDDGMPFSARAAELAPPVANVPATAAPAPSHGDGGATGQTRSTVVDDAH